MTIILVLPTRFLKMVVSWPLLVAKHFLQPENIGLAFPFTKALLPTKRT